MNTFLIYWVLIFKLLLYINFGSTHDGSSLSDNITERPVLKFPKDRPFKIVQFTDLHYEGKFIGDDLLTQAGQEKIIEEENPDFVMLSGDMISAYEWDFLNEETYKKTWNLFTEPMRKRNIPWSITFGNHDAEGSMTAYEMLELDRSYRLSLSEHGPPSIAGNSNYFLKIQPSNNTLNGSYIYVFDSDTPSCGSNGGWGCIQNSQIDWYKEMSDANNRLPSIAFVHIPPVEVIDLWNNYPVYGDFGDTECSCFHTHKYRFVDALLDQGDVKGLYFGHDHKNDFVGDYKGMSMGYGRKSGSGSYNPKYQQGARVFLIQENPYNITTYIRNNLGGIDEQKLHFPDTQFKFPLYCVKPGDHDNIEDWEIYFVLFMFLSVLVGFLQYKKTKKYCKYKPVEMT